MPQKPFSPPGTPLRFPTDRPFRPVHVRLELDLDLPGRSLSGVVTLRLESRQDGLRAVTLDAVEMTIEGVTAGGASVAAFDHDGAKLRIPLPQPLARGAETEVAVRYRCAPRRGLYFVGPDADHPDRAPQCWTQGQDEDSRYYFPCVDTPIEKAPTEVIATAPAGNFLLSNGDLRARDELPDGRVRWHYVLDFPHPPYLVTVACGPFAEVRDRAPVTGVDVYYYAPPGREADARRSMGRTPEMIDCFSERIGLPYPHKRYSQVTVPDFIFGGMENTTATTLTDLVLLDERAALDHDVEGLVSHELAHQWWGDLLTCRDWSEAWLNEGFAKYFEYVWREHARGRDEADVALLLNAEVYLGESEQYVRPIVCRQYGEPIHLFDRHLYEKGARVLHMVRRELGEDGFWAAVRHYAARFARTSVETRDLVRAIEEATGRNLEAFFDRWVARPGHPELDCGWEWDDARGVGRLRVQQKQAITDELPAFQFDAVVRLEVGGRMRDESIAVRAAAHVFELRLPERPTQVVLDPGDTILKTVKMEKPRALWRRQLEAAALGVDRVLAAGALGATPDPEAVAALGRALGRDPFWAVRAAAARALGRTRRQDALDRLLAARGDAHPRARRAVAAALGEMRGDARAAEALGAWAKDGDPSAFVEAEAAAALGRVRAPAALEILPSVMQRSSFQEVIRTRAIEGLGALGEADSGRAIEILRGEWRGGDPFPVRRALVAALAALGEGTPHARAVREYLEARVDDPDFRVRSEIAAAFVRLGDRRAIPLLEQALAGELDGRARRKMREAIAELREGARGSATATRLGEELERLRGETDKLRMRLEKLEARADDPDGAPGGGSSSAGARGKRKRARPVSRRDPRRPPGPIRRR